MRLWSWYLWWLHPRTELQMNGNPITIGKIKKGINFGEILLQQWLVRPDIKVTKYYSIYMYMTLKYNVACNNMFNR